MDSQQAHRKSEEKKNQVHKTLSETPRKFSLKSSNTITEKLFQFTESKNWKIN